MHVFLLSEVNLVHFLFMNLFYNIFTEDEMRAKYSLIRLAEKLKTKQLSLQFLRDHGVLPNSVVCDKCGATVTKTGIYNFIWLWAWLDLDLGLVLVNYSFKQFSVTHQNNTYFRCETESCHKKFSVRKDTVLYNSKMSFRRWVLMLYCFTKLTWTYSQSK